MSNAILVVLLVVTVANSSVLAYLLFSKSKGSSVAPELLKSVGARLIKIESFAATTGPDVAGALASVQALEKALGDVVKRLGDSEKRFSQVEVRLHKSLDELRMRNLRLEEIRSSSRSEPVAAPGFLPLNLEQMILSEIWKKFRDNRKTTEAMEKAVSDTTWQEIRVPLLSQLPQVVPEDLRVALEAILAPVQDSYNLVTKLSLVPRLMNGDLPKLESEAQEGMRLRELGTLLIMTQSSNLADRLNFRLGDWIEHHFLGFTDQFLQKYQQAQLEGAAEPLESCHQVVRQVLSMASLEPIALMLGSTLFDDRWHLELSAAHYPNLPDGVIIAVVRNGFFRSGQEVVRQAEVIVNRVSEPGEQL